MATERHTQMPILWKEASYMYINHVLRPFAF